MSDDDFIDSLRRVTIEALARRSDCMGEDQTHTPESCPRCSAFHWLRLACDAVKEVVEGRS